LKATKKPQSKPSANAMILASARGMASDIVITSASLAASPQAPQTTCLVYTQWGI
jgi:hypothetical protein